MENQVLAIRVELNPAIAVTRGGRIRRIGRIPIHGDVQLAVLNYEPAVRHRHVFRELEEFPGTLALLAPNDEPDTAVVFIHGFGGDPYTTWFNFHALIDECQEERWWARCDVFFYSYPSVSQQIKINALKLGDFLDQIYPTPNIDLFSIDASDIGITGGAVLNPFDVPPKYRNLVLVAHSEGAIIVRYLMSLTLQVLDNRAARAATVASSATGRTDPLRESLLSDAKLRLFAPAISGYRPAGLVGVITNMPLLGQMCTALASYSPAFLDMDPNELSDLRSDTEKSNKMHPELNGLRASILFGEDEKLVKAGGFHGDIVRTVPNKNHRNVCKPDRNYTLPLKFVCE